LLAEATGTVKSCISLLNLASFLFASFAVFAADFIAKHAKKGAKAAKIGLLTNTGAPSPLAEL
jgi:hypothetical protein